MKFRYGNAWEQFPIEKGQVWGLENGSSVAVHNIFNPLPEFMLDADLLFIDPPWNQGNLTAFYTKAERDDYQEFSDFEDALFQSIMAIAPHTCYLEVGFQAVERWGYRLSRIYHTMQTWDVFYYKTHRCHIIRGSNNGTMEYDFTDIDESKCIYKIAEIERYNLIGDLCMGQGLVGLASYAAGKPFVGTELNKRRLAVLLQKLSKKGATVTRMA